MPPLTDADAPPDDGFRDTGPPLPERYVEEGRRGDPLEDDFAFRGTVPPWPPVPAWVPAVCASGTAGEAAAGDPFGADGGLERPGVGLLDLTLPWATLTAEESYPGALGRIGPVTASQARYLAGRFAAGDHAATWRVVVTDDAGCATAVARMPRLNLAGDPALGPPLYTASNVTQAGRRAEGWGQADGGRPPEGRGQAEAGNHAVRLLRTAGLRTSGLAMTGLVGRITVVIPAREVVSTRDWETDAGGILAAVLTTARRASERARRAAEADRNAPGGCAHTFASLAYRPPRRTRDLVIARDVTCRYPGCGQPAWRGDLDHSRPWDRGGLTCSCNLGGLCRAHHILKQHPRWTLAQPVPGSFVWTTSAGRTYTTSPDAQPC